MSEKNKKATKRAIAFFDGQNLYHCAREAFGYSYPNYDPKALTRVVCKSQGWKLEESRFYTGIPRFQDDKFWNHFWTTKLGLFKKRKGVFVYKRYIRYIRTVNKLLDGRLIERMEKNEKGNV